MKTTTRTLALLLGMAMLAAPAPAGAAQLDVLGDDPATDVRTAEQLEQEADALASFPHRWDEVVELYRKAAAARPEGDPRTSWDLRQAGRIAFYVGKDALALRILRRAGDTALEYGDVVSAANLFLDAAWVAQESGEGAAAAALLTRAQRLARSPLLGAGDGSALRERLSPEAVGGGPQ